MILKASQRSHGAQLAAHLLNERDNDLVDIHEVSGFLSNDVAGAFAEIEAVSKGTRCQQPLFSMSLSPPPHERASVKDFEDAANRAEAALKLQGQPRVMVFHEKKDGRRHAHCVWSRIQWLLDELDRQIEAIQERINQLTQDLADAQRRREAAQANYERLSEEAELIQELSALYLGERWTAENRKRFEAVTGKSTEGIALEELGSGSIKMI